MPNTLTSRLDELGITPAEVAQIVKRPIELVEAWIDTGPDTEGVVLLRFLSDDADALRRVDQLRRTHTRNLRGDGATQAGVSLPYGSGHTGTTGGVPS